jgi:hypothetical protein
MLPTRFKAKLPKAFAYPIGAEAISGVLAGAPHTEDVGLSFYGQAVWPAREFIRLVSEGLPYRVLSAAYVPSLKHGRCPPKLTGRERFASGSWWISVYPVLRELRYAAGQLLREQGLPAVVEWLRSPGRPGWDTRQHAIELVFNPSEGSLSVTREDGV